MPVNSDLLGTAAQDGLYRYNQGGTPVLNRDLSAIDDGQVLGCDSREGFKQMALANEIGLRYLTFTSNQNPTTTLAKCALLDSTNTPQNLPISGDVGISLPSVDTTKTIGIYYGTYLADLTNINSTILGAQINPGDVLITLFGGQNASFYADNRNMRGLGRLYATASSDSISVAGVVKGVNRLLGVERAWADCTSGDGNTTCVGAVNECYCDHNTAYTVNSGACTGNCTAAYCAAADGSSACIGNATTCKCTNNVSYSLSGECIGPSCSGPSCVASDGSAFCFSDRSVSQNTCFCSQSSAYNFSTTGGACMGSGCLISPPTPYCTSPDSTTSCYGEKSYYGQTSCSCASNGTVNYAPNLGMSLCVGPNCNLFSGTTLSSVGSNQIGDSGVCYSNVGSCNCVSGYNPKCYYSSLNGDVCSHNNPNICICTDCACSSGDGLTSCSRDSSCCTCGVTGAYAMPNTYCGCFGANCSTPITPPTPYCTSKDLSTSCYGTSSTCTCTATGVVTTGAGTCFGANCSTTSPGSLICSSNGSSCYGTASCCNCASSTGVYATSDVLVEVQEVVVLLRLIV